jgi:biotin synthase-like enzyme
MSTLPKEERKKPRVRSFASILAETLITKKCGWDYGFLSGGIGAMPYEKLLELAKHTAEIMDEKIWISLGVIDKKTIEMFKPYVKGIVGTIEVLNPELHKKICPCKPIEPVERMFKESHELGLKNAMTLILGLGEDMSDFELLKKFIAKNHIDKIHLYSLNPQKGTAFEKCSPPSAEYQAEWIKKTREAFPEIDIQCGIWENRTDRIKALLEAGANSISKYPALKEFGSKSAFEIEEQAKLAGRKFNGTLTKMPKIDWDEKVEKLKLNEKLKNEIKIKVKEYIKMMSKNLKN